MEEHGTDSVSSDTAFEPPDVAPDTSTSAIDVQPTDVGESVDLAEPLGDAPMEDVPADVAEDLGASSSDAFADSSGDIGTEIAVEEPIDFSEPMDSDGAPDADAPKDWHEGEAIDLGHEEAEAPLDLEDTMADSSAEGEDLSVSPQSHAELADGGVDQLDADIDADAEDLGAAPVDSEFPYDHAAVGDTDQEIRELIRIAESEAMSTDELRAGFDANVGKLLDGDEPDDAVRAEQPGDAVGKAAVSIPPNDQIDTPDLRNSPDNEALADALAERNLVLEAVDRFDYSDNPILGYRESAPPDDIGYAVKAWNDQIAPGIASGATREDFEAHDRERGLEGHQRLAGVYDYFLGGDAIKSGGERDDGTLDVTGGRHRLEQARLNGVDYLPVKK